MPQTKKTPARKKASTASAAPKTKTAKAFAKPKSTKPTAAKNARPTAAKSTQPVAAKSAKPVAAKSTKPGAAQRTAGPGKQSLKKPSLNQHPSKKQSPQQQRPPRPAAKKPSAQKPGAQKPGAKKPGARKPAAKKPLFPSLPQSNLEALKLARSIAQLLLEKKATDVVLFDVCQKSSYADVIVVASGTSEPHLSSLSRHLWESLKKNKVRPHSVEGSGSTSWVLMDFGDVVVHLFLPEIRALYDLDGLWSDVPRESF